MKNLDLAFFYNKFYFFPMPMEFVRSYKKYKILRTKHGGIQARLYGTNIVA